MEQVTKTKNEGRVAAGKRLAEWNRKNKEDLLKNKEQVEKVPTTSGAQVVASGGQVVASHIGLYGGTLLLVGAGIAVYFYAFGYTRQKAPVTPAEPPKIQPKKYMD